MEYFSDDQIAQLVDRLINATRAGTLKWQPVASDSYSFIARISNAVFRLSSKDKDDLAPHLLHIYSTSVQGSPQELQVINSIYLVPDLADRLEALYQLVKRETLQLDAIARNILGELDELAQDEPPF